MNRFFQLIVVILLLASCNSSVMKVKEVEALAAEIGKQYAPDHREAIFNVSITSKGSMLQISGELTSAEAKAKLLSVLKEKGFTVVDSLTVLPDKKISQKNWGLVNISVCNMRTRPGHDAEMASQAILGTPVKILKKSGSWSQIQTPDQYIGWVDDDALVAQDSTGMDTWRKTVKMIYLQSFGIGINPETKDAVTDLVAGSILKLVNTNQGACLLEMPDGRKLEVNRSDLIDFDAWKKQSDLQATALFKCAKTLLGRPYLWGGTSTKGIDCSGFVKTVYFLNGIILARDASLQFKYGGVTTPEQGYKSLKEGDLIFFGKRADKDHPAKATHVGLYLGNGEYIHSSGFVRINSFDPSKENFSKHRAENWLGGRTILGNYGPAGIVKVANHPWY